MPSRIYSPEDPEVVNSNTILKHILKKKYDWVIDVNLVFITVRESRTDRDYNEIVLDGVIKVDKDWYENQWREYNYYNLPIPDPNGDGDVVLGELLGSELAMKFNSECRKAITLSLKRQIQGLIWSSLVVRTEEVKKEDMTESIRRILREETENYILKFANQIDKIGLFNFLKTTNFSYTKLFSMIGDEWLTRKVKQEFIKDVMNMMEFGFGLSEIGEEPIFYKENENEIWQIDYLGKNMVAIDILSKSAGGEEGSFNISYSALDDNILDSIFDVMVLVYENNKDLT
jgi:hypothetical protein